LLGTAYIIIIELFEFIAILIFLEEQDDSNHKGKGTNIEEYIPNLNKELGALLIVVIIEHKISPNAILA
jgi:hypothetical protein